MPLTQITDTYFKDAKDKGHRITDHTQFEYFGVDHWQPSTVTTKRDYQGSSPPSTAQFLYDANGITNGKLYSDDEIHMCNRTTIFGVMNDDGFDKYH